MNTQSHLAISLAVQRVLEKELSVKLDTTSFVFGNVRQDFSLRHFTVRHFKTDASEYIDSQIKSLMSCRISKNKKCTRRFSEKLGAITHYLADFFCFAHSNAYDGGLISHFLYERRLGHYFRKNFKNIEGFSQVWYADTYNGYRLYHNSIGSLYDHYANEGPSLAADMIFALNACIAAVCSIIAVCLAGAV